MRERARGSPKREVKKGDNSLKEAQREDERSIRSVARTLLKCFHAHARFLLL